MAIIDNFYLFLLSVAFISMSGVLMPGPLFAVTIEKASKHKFSGALIALGHGVVEFPLMFLILFLLIEFSIPWYIQALIGLVGGLLLISMGIHTYRRRNAEEGSYVSSKQESLLAGIRTTAANPGFILWWLTVGTALILNAQVFGPVGFSIFAGLHWSCDFVWYTVVAFLIFKSNKFWTPRVYQLINYFCVVILVGFGAWFFLSSAAQVFAALT